MGFPDERNRQDYFRPRTPGVQFVLVPQWSQTTVGFDGQQCLHLGRDERRLRTQVPVSFANFEGPIPSEER